MPMWRFVPVSVIEWGHRHHQAAVLDTLESNQQVCKVFHTRGFAMNDQYFKTGIVVEMRVSGGDNEVVVRVLRFSELFGDAGGMVVIDQRNGANDGGIGRGGLLADQPVANQIAKGFGAVRIAALRNGAVKPVQEIGVEGNADSAQFTHTRIIAA